MRAGVAALAGAALLAGCGEDKTKPLQVSPQTYQQMVEAFSTGVLALIAIAAFVLRDRTRPLPRRRLVVLWGALLGQWLL
jgi:hypothetical protein